MLKIDFSNLSQIYQQNPKHGLSIADFKKCEQNFEHFDKQLNERKQGFLDLGNDEKLVLNLQTFAKENQGKYKQIVILGIGGSMLGPQFLVDALGNSSIQIFCLDNIDPDQINKLQGQLKLNQTLFLVQTKSGTTPETLAQYFYFRNLINEAKLEAKNHFVFVTDPEVGYLRQVAERENIPSFPIPASVGGRFSVLSSVGLLIAALLDLDIAKMLEGAQTIAQKQRKEAYKLAICQYLLSQKSKNITVMMPYSSPLRMLASWYTQLLSESIGKEYDLEGKKVNVGLTPVPALGATDQHSQLQLFKEGPNDKLIIFIEVQKVRKDLLIGQDLPSQFDYLNNKTFGDLLKAELEGTCRSLTESLRPNLTLSVQKVNEFHVGQLIMFLELSVAYLGELFNINTFDQPGVERSKVLAKELLEKIQN